MNEEVYAHALALLVIKNYFTGELLEKLEKKFPEERSFEDVIKQLNKDRYLDDERYYKDFVRWRAESGYGPYYIKEKLWQKGVNKSIEEISDVIEESEINVEELIRESIRKYRRTKNKKPDKFMNSCLTWLRGRGFAVNDCIEILKQEVSEYESNFFEGR